MGASRQERPLYKSPGPPATTEVLGSAYWGCFPAVPQLGDWPGSYRMQFESGVTATWPHQVLYLFSSRQVTGPRWRIYRTRTCYPASRGIQNLRHADQQKVLVNWAHSQKLSVRSDLGADCLGRPINWGVRLAIQPRKILPAGVYLNFRAMSDRRGHLFKSNRQRLSVIPAGSIATGTPPGECGEIKPPDNSWLIWSNLIRSPQIPVSWEAVGNLPAWRANPTCQIKMSEMKFGAGAL